MQEKIPITVAYGDGIGPEIMKATLQILKEAGAKLDIEIIEIGKKVYESGVESGIEDSSWESLRRTKVFFKAPITTPQGGGFKSLNVTIRKGLGLYANVRPCVSFYPFIETKHPKMDVVIIRENEEDLYAGIEHQQTPQVAQCLKLISLPGCERIIRYAFEYAKQNNRKKVSCFSKDNIMKITDGIFHKVFTEIGKDYPEIEKEHLIIDIATARLADTPENFDVIVTLNLYGDIISDVAAQITGSIGLAGSSNIGESCAMFEAIHGSAPDIAGQNLANPSGLILASVMMLIHISQPNVASLVHNAWLKTIEDGIHTADIFKPKTSKSKVGTDEFTKEVIQRLGTSPSQLPAVNYPPPSEKSKVSIKTMQKIMHPKDTRKCVGVDIFLHLETDEIKSLLEKLQNCQTSNLKLKMISNRGTKVWPDPIPIKYVDHWRCRFISEKPIQSFQIIELLQKVEQNGLEFIKLENLYLFGQKRGFSD